MPGVHVHRPIGPVCEIGMSDVREAEPDSWMDVSCHVHEVEIFRGRERFSDHFMPATASITFDNRTGWGDLVGAPLIVAGQTLRPARPIRVGVPACSMTTRWSRPVGCTGVGSTRRTPAYDPVLHDVVTVNCIDAFGEAGQSVAPTGPRAGGERDGDRPGQPGPGRGRLVPDETQDRRPWRRRCRAPRSARGRST